MVLIEAGPKVRPGAMADAVQREEAQGAEGWWHVRVLKWWRC